MGGIFSSSSSGPEAAVPVPVPAAAAAVPEDQNLLSNLSATLHNCGHAMSLLLSTGDVSAACAAAGISPEYLVGSLLVLLISFIAFLLIRLLHAPTLSDRAEVGVGAGAGVGCAQCQNCGASVSSSAGGVGGAKAREEGEGEGEEEEAEAEEKGYNQGQGRRPSGIGLAVSAEDAHVSQEMLSLIERFQTSISDLQVKHHRLFSKPGNDTFVVAITGGPCGGKTTGMSTLSKHLKNRGYNVYVVPELPTILIGGGATFGNLTTEQLFTFENHLLHAQLALEDSFRGIAKRSGNKSIILCDRGVLDIKAYVSDKMWSQLLWENGHREEQLRNLRYDAVVHMVTAADGAEAFYTRANNAARRETAEEARALDLSIRDAWEGHPNLGIIGNDYGSFDAKLENVLKFVCDLLGESMPPKHSLAAVVSTVLATNRWAAVNRHQLGQLHMSPFKKRLAQIGQMAAEPDSKEDVP